MSTPARASALPPELDPRRPARPSRPARRGGGAGGSRLGRLLTLLSVLVVVGTTVLYGAVNYYSGRLGRISIGGIFNHTSPSAAADGAQNFLLIGSDTRAGSGSQYQAARGSADFVTGQRSDTVILAHLPPGNARATLVSFPRDSWVQIPAYRDSHGVVHPPHMDKLNAAFSLGGPPLLIALIENLSGMRVDHFVEIDFVGFKKMVDALGGVNICVQSPRRDPQSGNFMHRGVQRLNGTKALAFVRQRYGLPHGDLDRIKDQQYFLSVVLHKVLSAGTLANPFTLTSFLDAATSAVTVDTGLSLADMRTLALRLRHVDPAHVTFVTVPVANPAGVGPAGQSIVLLDQAKMAALFAALRDDASSGHHGSSGRGSGRLSVTPSAVSVRVENGAGITGLAARAAAGLRGEGFVVTGTGNAPTTGATASVVRYGPAAAGAARTLAAAVPGASLQPDSTLGSGLVLVVGSSFNGVSPVSAGAAPAPSAGGSSGSSGSSGSAGSTGAGAPAPQTSPTTAASVSCAP